MTGCFASSSDGMGLPDIQNLTTPPSIHHLYYAINSYSDGLGFRYLGDALWPEVAKPDFI